MVIFPEDSVGGAGTDGSDQAWSGLNQPREIQVSQHAEASGRWEAMPVRHAA